MKGTELEELKAKILNLPNDEKEEIIKNSKLSFEQERLWLIDKINKQSLQYNICVALKLSGQVDLNVFQQSLITLTNRHSCYRTLFWEIQGEPIQLIFNSLNNCFEVNIGKCLKNNVLEIIAKESRYKFDLSKGPLLRVNLIQVEQEEYILIMNVHHIISDDWSLRIFFNELSEIYDAFQDGRNPILPELPIQYIDFSIWQRNWLNNQRLKQLSTWWQKNLDGAPELINLPADFMRPAEMKHQGALYSFDISKEVTEDLKKFANSQNVTLFTLLLTGYLLLIHRYTELEDLVIGTPISGRSQVELENLIGFFVNVVPLRVNLSGCSSFLELLKRVNETVIEAFAHQELPFSKLVESLQVTRSLSYHPIFQILFTFQNSPGNWKAPKGLKFSRQLVDNQTSKFDLSLIMEENKDGLLGVLEYNTDLFKRERIENMSNHLRILLKNVISNSEKAIHLLPYMSELEKNRILYEWNSTKQNYPLATVVDLFELQVTNNPDRVALIFENLKISYAELNNKANIIAQWLYSEKMKIGTIVGVCMDRSIELVIVLLGILKAGAAYLPVDPEWPSKRKELVCKDAKVNLIITDKKNASFKKRRALVFKEYHSDLTEIAIKNFNKDYKLPGPSIKDLAYVIYTSGTTGCPKGVMIEHKNFSNYLYWCSKVYFQQKHSHVLFHSSIAFDFTITELFGGMVNGASIKIIRQGEEITGLISELSSTSEISVLKLTPSHMEIISTKLTSSNLPKALINVLIAGGEPLFRTHLEFWQPISKTIINEYGPTETTVGCCTYLLNKDSAPPIDSSSIPIGHPIDNTNLYVLDEYKQLSPIGISGELYIEGDCVARGYLGRIESNDEKFISSILDSKEKLLYKTGDLVVLKQNMQLYFIGRKDRQSKVLGFRIELDEIESILRKHKKIYQASVSLKQVGKIKEILAFVTTKTKISSRTLKRDIQNHLIKHLPRYMLPTNIAILPFLPVNINGKFDIEKALEMIKISTRKNKCLSKKNEVLDLTERKLHTLIQNILKNKIGLEDEFLLYGTNSIDAIRIISAINIKFRVELSIATFFSCGSIKKLAREIHIKNSNNIKSSSIVPLRKGYKKPLFIFHPTGGHVSCYIHLAKIIQSTDVIYGVQSPAWSQEKKIFLSISEMVRSYVQNILETQEIGPFSLCGWSAGGIIAQAVAEILFSLGFDIDALIMIDSAYPGYINTSKEEIEIMEDIVNEYGYSIKDILQKIPKKQWKHELLTLGRKVGAEWAIQEINEFQFNFLFESYKVCLNACEEHIPGYIPCSANIIATNNYPFSKQWQEKFLNLSIHHINATHRSIIQPPHVQQTAGIIDNILNKLK
ncbi:MAG: amino acid adenylation domain-containing protein [Rickettsiaceae bacterium]|nr:amino acid adenylation domain-containing protein [Rickettsiaceae bacterium]